MEALTVVVIVAWLVGGAVVLRKLFGKRASARRTSHETTRRGHGTEGAVHMAWLHDTGATHGEGGYGEAGFADGGFDGGDFGGGLGDGDGGGGGGE